MKLGWSTLLLLAGSGCFYSFDNPVELQDAGSIAGHVVFTSNPGKLSPGGGQVGLLWTDLNITVNQDGRFLFLGLPDGVYTLKYELDPGDGGLPLMAFLPGITLPQEPGNVPDAIDIGTIVLNPVARVTGHVSGMGDAGNAVVGAFGPSDAGEVFESFTVMTDDGGNFTLDLPGGSHDIWASTATVSGSTALTVPSGQITDLGELALAPPAAGGPGASGRQRDHADPNDGDPNGELVGDLVLGLPGFGASADPAAVEDAGLVQTNVEINPPPPPEDPFTLSSQVPGKGAHMNQTLPPGQIYPSIYCGLKGSQPPGPETLNDIGLTNIPTFVGHPTILGQITWLPVSTFGANGQQAPPDYGTGTTSGTTTSGSTTGGSTSGGGSTGGGASSTGGSTTGFPFFDAGPPAFWQDFAESPVADGGTDDGDPFIVVPSAKGPMLFYTNFGFLYLVQPVDGAFQAVASYDPGGNYIQLRGAGTDELGVPTAALTEYITQQEQDVTAIAQADGTGNWTLITCGGNYVYSTPVLVPAPAGSTAAGGPSLYMYFLQSNGPLYVASIYTTNEPHCDVSLVNSSDSDAGIGSFNQVAGGACETSGDAGVCLALSDYYRDVVWATSFDLRNPALALIDPLQLSSFEDGYVPLGVSAVVTGPPGSQLLTATWYEGYVDPVPGQMMAQRVPTSYLDALNPGGELPPALTFDAGIDPDAGTPLYYFYGTLALSSGDLPFVIGTAQSTQFSSSAPPYQHFAYDLVSGAPFPDLPADAGVASFPFGYVDPVSGIPYVSTAADDGQTLNAQIWTYAR